MFDEVKFPAVGDTVIVLHRSESGEVVSAHKPITTTVEATYHHGVVRVKSGDIWRVKYKHTTPELGRVFHTVPYMEK